MPAFRYTFKDKYASAACVYKMYFGKKYFIWKGKALKQSVDNCAKEIDRSLRLGCKDNDIFEWVVEWIKKARVQMMEVEVVLADNNPLELLKTEYTLLQAGEGDLLCLNLSFEPYLPSWISQADQAAFQKWTQAQKRSASRKKRSTAKKAPKGRDVKKLSSPKKTGSKGHLNTSGKVSTKNGTSAKKLSIPKGTKTPAKKRRSDK